MWNCTFSIYFVHFWEYIRAIYIDGDAMQCHVNAHLNKKQWIVQILHAFARSVLFEVGLFFEW